MKKFAALCIVGVALSLSACETNQTKGGTVVHNEEHSAPYADERTVRSAEPVFVERQAK